MDTTMDTTSRNKTQKVMLKNIGLRLDLWQNKYYNSLPGFLCKVQLWVIGIASFSKDSFTLIFVLRG